jgi:hypothetical protein
MRRKAMNQSELEVNVNYEFSQMLKALEAKGAFGTQETTLPAFRTILAEAGMRLFAFGESEGASLEVTKDHDTVFVDDCYCGHAKSKHLNELGECSECAPNMCAEFRVRGLVATK